MGSSSLPVDWGADAPDDAYPFEDVAQTRRLCGFAHAVPGHEEAMARKSKDGMRGLEHENDPRGGRQSPDYRTADPRDLVVEGDTVMSGPAGAPQEREPELRRRSRKRAR
jgi:hypothetical protein